MSELLLSVRNLHARLEDGQEILCGFNLDIRPGEVHAIMGPNGSGKSTLAKVLAGHPSYEVTEGSVTLDGKDVLELEIDERSRAGLFLAFQYPCEIAGVSIANFLRTAYNAHRGNNDFPILQFGKLLREKMEMLQMDPSFAKRFVNDGFSGGEKKRNEILQLAILEPKLAVLDETDSGLDIDALKIVASGVNAQRDSKRGFLLITHYQRLLDYIVPDVVHVMVGGKIVETGTKELALKLEETGYDEYLNRAGLAAPEAGTFAATPA